MLRFYSSCLSISLSYQDATGNYIFIHQKLACKIKRQRRDLYQLSSSKAATCVPHTVEALHQRWSRGHKARGQGQGHKKNPRPRPRTAFPRTEPLEAKDRNVRGQAKDRGHRRKRSPKKKVVKNIFQAISNSLAYPKFLIKEGLSHKSHDIRHQNFSKEEVFAGQRYCRMKDLKSL